jgi:hypothetical protein
MMGISHYLSILNLQNYFFLPVYRKLGIFQADFDLDIVYFLNYL